MILATSCPTVLLACLVLESSCSTAGGTQGDQAAAEPPPSTGPVQDAGALRDCLHHADLSATIAAHGEKRVAQKSAGEQCPGPGGRSSCHESQSCFDRLEVRCCAAKEQQAGQPLRQRGELVQAEARHSCCKQIQARESPTQRSRTSLGTQRHAGCCPLPPAALAVAMPVPANEVVLTPARISMLFHREMHFTCNNVHSNFSHSWVCVLTRCEHKHPLIVSHCQCL